MILVIIIGVASYWSNLQYKSALAAQARITELEKRLSVTGDEMGHSAVAVQVKVTEWSERTNQLWEQMDKLWASAWCRNQSEIKDLSKSLTTQNTSLSNKISSAEAGKPNIELKQQFSGLREKLMSTASANNNLTSRLDELDKRLKAAEEAARKQISTPAQGTGL